MFRYFVILVESTIGQKRKDASQFPVFLSQQFCQYGTRSCTRKDHFVFGILRKYCPQHSQKKLTLTFLE